MCILQTHLLINIYMDTLRGATNSFNLGETHFSWEERHRGRDYAKAKQVLIQLDSNYDRCSWWTDVSTRTDKDHHHDSIIHDWLVTLFGIKKIGQETFEFDPNIYTLDIIAQRIYEKFFSGKDEECEVFEPRPCQTKFLQKISTAWEQKQYLAFLLFAKCRSGKSAMVLKHIVDSNYELSIVCSRQNSPQASWMEDSKRFFCKIKYISINETNWENQIEFWKNRNVNIVLWGTVQSLINRLDKIGKVNFLALDEAHIGATAKQFEKVRDHFNTRTCYISGTAHKLCWKFPEEDQKFVYTYFDEQLDVQRGVFKRPKMNVAFAKYKTAAYQKLFGDDPDAMKNIFTMEGDKFLHEMLVREFVNNYFGPQRELRIGDRLLRGKYLMMAMPSVKACHAFQKLVNCYYPALVVTSDTNNDQNDINHFLEEHPKALIITQSANVLGLTAKKIDTVINCRGGNSLEFWIQLAFRGGSGDHDWWVIDFDPQRCLRSIHNAFQLACDNNNYLSKYSVFEFINIHEWNDGFKMLSKEMFEDVLACDVGGSISTITIILQYLDLSNIMDFNLNLKSYLTTVIKESQLNDNGANNKSCVILETEREKTIDDLDTLKKKQTIKALLESIPLIICYIIRNGQNVYSINDVIGSQVYTFVSGDYECILSDVISKNPHIIEPLTRRIGIVSHSIQKSMRDSVSNTIGELSVSLQTHQSIPLKLFDSMVDGCKDFTKTYIFGDPSGSHTARLLERGVDPRNLTVWESCDSHRNRVKYIDNNVKVVDSHPNMKFTAILSNPPYKDDSKAKNNKLWHKIINQHLPLLVPGGDMCEVTPASVLSITGEGKKFLKLFSTRYNLVEIDYTADQYFTESVSICSWHLVNEPYQGKTKVITKEGEFEWDLRNGVPVFGDNVLKQDILLKIANSNHRRIPLKIGQEIATKDYVPDGKYEIYHSSKKIKRTNVIPTTGDILKFIVPFSSTYKNGGIFISNGYVGMLNCWCPIASEEEGNRLNKIFDLNIIQFYIDNYKKSAGFTASIKNGEVSDITDYNNLPEQFGFTEEEVDYLKRINVL